MARITPSPHALTTANGVGYSYDANGNMTSGNGRAINWYSYNKPYSIAKGTTTSTFMYGPDRARIQQVVTTGSGKPTEYRHYIGAGSRASIYTQKSDSTGKTRYLHKDHLGSVDVIAKEDGMVAERLSFDPHGKRRQIKWQAIITSIVPLETSRGFTGHEHLDGVGLEWPYVEKTYGVDRNIAVPAYLEAKGLIPAKCPRGVVVLRGGETEGGVGLGRVQL